MNKEKLLGVTPLPELIIRKIYYSDNFVVKKIMLFLKTKSFRKKMEQQNDLLEDSAKWDYIKKHIENLNIQKGDILIVHSSTDELSKIGINPNEVLQFLYELVGESGTLAIPCFPLYDNKSYDASRNAYVYNPKRTICSTGMLPNLFMRTKGVCRSQFPWNTLAAKGPLAESMMEHNMSTDLPHGKGSAWEFCMNHNAKILLLGVKSSHTTTMVHVAEDILDKEWPIDDWYEERLFIVKDGSCEVEKQIRVRKQKWAKYNASWYRSNKFIKMGILNEEEVEGFNIGFIEDSKAMVDFIIERTLKHKSFFVVPKRCYKK